jgi:Loader and inhibitor of phage G40P.
LTVQETRDILTVLKTNYPNSFKNMSKEQSYSYLDLWATAFANDKKQDVINAVKEIIYTDTREFAPNIAQVKARMKPTMLLENENIMKKYDEHYDDQYNYRKDEMKNRILHNPYHIPDDEMKSDFKKCIGIDYEAYMNLLQSYLNGAIPKLMKGEL